MADLEKQRNTMIEQHLKARGIRDPQVLQAMQEVPREKFIPESMAAYAYDDSPLPIGEDQTISQPYIVALMTQYLSLTKNDKVLEIGAGSGYAAAVLSRIASEVYTIERYESLAETARSRLKRLGYDNVSIAVGDGTLGWPEHAPFNAIVVTGGAPEVPDPLRKQLAVGGRLVIPVGGTPRSQELVRVYKVSDREYQQERLAAVRFVPLIGEAGWRNAPA